MSYFCCYQNKYKSTLNNYYKDFNWEKLLYLVEKHKNQLKPEIFISYLKLIGREFNWPLKYICVISH